MSKDGRASIIALDRPAATFEILEAAAIAVESTQRGRGQGTRRGTARPVDSLSLRAGLVPIPDGWTIKGLRKRIDATSERFKLSRREKQVLRGMVRGLSNDQIAEQLGVSVHAVKKTGSQLLKKLRLQSRFELPWLLDRVGVDQG